MNPKPAQPPLSAKDEEIRSVALRADAVLDELSTILAQMAATLTPPDQPGNNERLVPQ